MVTKSIHNIFPFRYCFIGILKFAIAQKFSWYLFSTHIPNFLCIQKLIPLNKTQQIMTNLLKIFAKHIWKSNHSNEEQHKIDHEYLSFLWHPHKIPFTKSFSPLITGKLFPNYNHVWEPHVATFIYLHFSYFSLRSSLKNMLCK